MSALRILSIANVPEDPNAGAAGAEFQTIRALRRLGHTVDALWADDIHRRISHGNLHYLLELPRRYEALVRDRLSEGEYDVVHVSQPHGFRAARLVRRRWPQIPFIHRSHGFEPRVEEIAAYWHRFYEEGRRPRWRQAATALLRAALRRHYDSICRWADGHLLCSTEDAEFMMTRFAVPASRIAVVTHAAPDDYLGSTVLPLTTERLRHVLYVGQYTFIKAPMVVAAAMNEIGAARLDARFTWVAARDHHDHIRSLLSPDVRERLTLVHWMSQRELRGVYDDAGIFLFPSFFEGTGKASIEALSRGMCVVATDVGGMHDMIEPAVSGMLVPAGNPHAVAAAALGLMNDLERARDVATAAAARARQYTWELTATKTAAFYSECIEAKRRRGPA